MVVSKQTPSVEPIGVVGAEDRDQPLLARRAHDDRPVDPLGGGVAPLGEQEQLGVGVVAEVRLTHWSIQRRVIAHQLREQPRPLATLLVAEVVVEGPLGDREHDGVEALLVERQVEDVHLADDRVELGLGGHLAGRELEDAALVEGGVEALGRASRSGSR